MDKNEIRAIVITLIVMATFITVLFVARAQQTLDVPECIPGQKPEDFKPGLVKIADKKYDLFIKAKMWGFVADASEDPTVQVHIPAGSTVDIYLTSQDVMHSLNIWKKGISMMAAYGAVNKRTVHFNEKGKYTLVCAEYCGTQHQNMQQIINVE